ncbi:MAG TPA: RagB/SusD family nutrient uptake outer membrane protein [Saprospiraceae bacterium]|nr:RagB/SusD family nutrient uptake outer membrane protein [Saprospiraceae bacterium]HNT20129.1 RagB/SusD family nutrient uptake outer membrane protein [Saprospiraceae bacterium]
MKKSIYIFLIFIFAACDKELDVKPTQSIDETNALATAQDVKVTLTGAYDGLADGDVYGGGFQFTSELVADDREVRFIGTFAGQDEMWRKAMTTGNAQVLATWRDAYVAINRANNVLSALDKLDAADKSQVEGEARLIRGATYLGLINLFAKAWGDGDQNNNPGVPLVTTPTRVVTDEDNRPRATVAAVYAQILEDFTKAETLIPESADQNGFGTRNAATALLARTYLIQGNFAAARDAAHKVIASGSHALAESYVDVFYDKSGSFDGESIFKVIITEQDGVNSMNTYFAPATFAGRGDIVIQTKHTDLYGPNDPRGQFTVTTSRGVFTGKHLDQFGDISIIRLAEMYLIRAETNFRLGTVVGASPLEDLNAIRDRAGAGLLTLDQINLDRILLDRKLELMFEGQLLQDVRRLKKNVGTLPFSDPKMVLPIPQREIDTNKSLVQNSGY